MRSLLASNTLAGVISEALRTMPPLVIASWVVLVVLVLAGMLSPAVAPYGLNEQHLIDRLRPPVFMGGSFEYPLGTDHLGRDALSRLLYATGTTFMIAFLGVLIGVVVGTVAGLVGGALGGWVDHLLVILIDAQASVPITLLALTAVALIGTEPVLLIVIVGLAEFYKYARVVRGQVLVMNGRAFIEAIEGLGATRSRVILRHILPNIISPVIVLATMNVNGIVVLESALSFLGVGIQPPYTSLGQLLGDGRSYLITAWWLAAIPCAVIVAITMTICLIGDWLRDYLDPQIHR